MMKEGTIEDAFKMLSPAEMTTSLRVFCSSHVPTKLELSPVDLKLEGPTTYLGWSSCVKKLLQ